MQSLLPETNEEMTAASRPCQEVRLTIIYENRPSQTILGLSPNDEAEAELNAFRQARDLRFLEGAKMLLVHRGNTTHAEFFSHSKAYRRFLDSA